MYGLRFLECSKAMKGKERQDSAVKTYDRSLVIEEAACLLNSLWDEVGDAHHGWMLS